MSGDSGDLYQARILMSLKKDPDREYRGLSRTEIENRVKKQCAHMIGKSYSLKLKNGRKIKPRITSKNIEHFISDAGGRAKGSLNISDIKKLDSAILRAVHVNSADDVKKVGSGVKFHYFRTKIHRKTIFLNVREDRKGNNTDFHSVTKKIR